MHVFYGQKQTKNEGERVALMMIVLIVRESRLGDHSLQLIYWRPVSAAAADDDDAELDEDDELALG
jgi:hypothetical protein